MEYIYFKYLLGFFWFLCLPTKSANSLIWSC